ncbi:hypothetical protein LINPERHAP1_LOCUS39990, partial [Linum perenne]
LLIFLLSSSPTNNENPNLNTKQSRRPYSFTPPFLSYSPALQRELGRRHAADDAAARRWPQTDMQGRHRSEEEGGDK